MMHLVNVLVDAVVVEQAVEEVVPGVLDDSTEETPTQNGVPVGIRQIRTPC